MDVKFIVALVAIFSFVVLGCQVSPSSNTLDSQKQTSNSIISQIEKMELNESVIKELEDYFISKKGERLKDEKGNYFKRDKGGLIKGDSAVSLVNNYIRFIDNLPHYKFHQKKSASTSVHFSFLEIIKYFDAIKTELNKKRGNNQKLYFEDMGMRLYFGKYNSDSLSSTIVIRASEVQLGTFTGKIIDEGDFPNNSNELDDLLYFNLGDLCPKNCPGDKTPGLFPISSERGMIH